MIDANYRFQLDSPKITGRRQQKSTCPHCHRKRCFVRYIDTHNQYRYLNDGVGRCDHEQSCGYHYRPSEYFRDNPWQRDCLPTNFYCQPTPVVQRPMLPLPMDYVVRSHSPKSIFWQWMTSVCLQQLGILPDVLRRIYEDYLIGATKQGEIIFWQIDEQDRVRSGHIMRYGTDGHRLPFQSWTHTRLQKKGLLPNDFQLYQCLFGQHLLPKRPDDHVCIVESEKTALIMAACFPQYLWLATCGSHGLTAEKAACLKGRRVTIFPDSGCLKEWQAIMSQTKGINYFIDGKMEEYPPNTDLADVLLEEL